ncbi:MAG: hypothetical protein U0840_12750 [Gemmataceae bacterium]
MEPLPWWGRVGETYFGPLAFAPGAIEGLVRHVGPCVAFEPTLPYQRLGLTAWRQTPLDPRRFEQPLPARPATLGIVTLADFAEDLASHHPARRDPRLADLDAVVRRLLQIAIGLHAAGFRLGYLTPRAILVQRGADGLTLHLPDLGFYNTADDFDQPWLAPRDEWANLCAPDLPAAQHRLQGLASTGPLPDIRLLARLLACVLLAGRAPGPTEQLPPLRPGEPWVVLRDIPALRQAPALRADIWGVLQRAISGEIATMDEFARQVEAHPLSDHYRGGSARPRSLAWLVGLTGGVATLLVAGACAAWYLRPPVEPSSDTSSSMVDPHTPSPALPEEAPPELRAIEEAHLAKLPPARQAEAIVAAYAATPAEPGPEARRVLQRARWLLVQAIRREMHRQLDELEPTPLNRRLLAGFCQAHLDALLALQTFPADPALASEENQCRDELGRLLLELQD